MLAFDYTALAEPALRKRRKPKGPVKIIPSHRLSRDLYLQYLLRKPSADNERDLVTREPLLKNFSAKTQYSGRHKYVYRMDNDGSSTQNFYKTGTLVHGIGTDDFTWCAWIYKVSDTGQAYQGAMANGSFSPATYVEFLGGNWGAYWNSFFNAGEVWPTGAWHHQCLTRRNGIAYLYRDGVEKASVDWSIKSLANAVFRLATGSGAVGDSSDLMMDDVRFYKRGLSVSDIREIIKDGMQHLRPPGWIAPVHFLGTAGAPPAGTIPPLHFHHRHHNLAG